MTVQVKVVTIFFKKLSKIDEIGGIEDLSIFTNKIVTPENKHQIW